MPHCSIHSMFARVLGAVALFSLLLPASAGAQERPNTVEVPDGRSVFDVSLRGGVASLAGGSDLFHLMRRELTFVSSDLRTPAWGVETSVRIVDRLDLLAGWETGSWSATTQVRESQGDLDGAQRFSLDVDRSLYAGLRLHLTPTGVDRPGPRAPDVFITAGAGWKRIDLRQEGDFPDRVNELAFPATFSGNGETAWGFGGVGMRVPLPAATFLLGEIRYQGGAAEVGGDFHALEPVDLSGVSLALGLGWSW